ncbi:MAG: hypothetical protein KBF76_06570 [Verrucomicrobiales bacterium]|nr:hypothetical protein [Verrucomicrobiales bacterium]
MNRTTFLSLLSVLALVALTLSGCAGPNATGGVTGDGYSAPPPTSPIDRTTSLQNQFRDLRS